jgi:endonuclease YncB( thermonuclease family)
MRASRSRQATLAFVLLVSAPALARDRLHAELVRAREPAPIAGRATIIDGDTIAVEGTAPRVRLYGIDTPEGQQTCDDAQGKRYLCGSDASQALAEIIGRNGRVSCTEEDRDRYGRIVAECVTTKGVNVNAAMVATGWALEYVQYSDGRYHEHELEAKAAKRGLWAGRFVEPWNWRKAERQNKGHSEGPTAPVTPLLALIAPIAARRSCKAVSTCEEAVKVWCDGYARADADDDGIPCENVCRTKAQVDAIKPKVGCLTH